MEEDEEREGEEGAACDGAVLDGEEEEEEERGLGGEVAISYKKGGRKYVLMDMVKCIIIMMNLSAMIPYLFSAVI